MEEVVKVAVVEAAVVDQGVVIHQVVNLGMVFIVITSTMYIYISNRCATL